MKKVILITGTRKGIGKGLSEYYLSKDFLVAGCSKGQPSIEHKNYVHYSLSVSDEKAVVKMVKDVLDKFSRIDILLNNAGIASMNHLILTPYKTMNSIHRTNFLGSFLFIREVGKVMIRQKQGRIVNFTTVAVPLRLEGEAAYVTSKAAIETLTQVAAKELAEFNITVNALGPTPVKTALIRTVPQDKIKDILNRQAIKRFGEIRDIINIIDFFIDERSDFITGQVIYLGGISG